MGGTSKTLFLYFPLFRIYFETQKKKWRVPFEAIQIY